MSDNELRMGAAYWRKHAARGPALKPLGRPCWDCAVVCGMYQPLSDELAEQPADVREAVCGNWFCHNHGDRACAGNIENIRRLLARHPHDQPLAEHKASEEVGRG